ncbi:MAG TPA: multiprotein-bridging factor 1 family protein, partial [Methanobacterium sp.]|nr:multiprotein-bridging factor 1 family protein [Methanobacterium sp.]
KPRTPPSRLRSREPSYEVSEDYNTLIRTARERNNWSREELAQKLNEKTSVINRIESSKMIPDIKLARKIERLLKIQILEKIDDEHQEDSVSSTKGGTTIGDIAMIKKR